MPYVPKRLNCFRKMELAPPFSLSFFLDIDVLSGAEESSIPGGKEKNKELCSEIAVTKSLVAPF